MIRPETVVEIIPLTDEREHYSNANFTVYSCYFPTNRSDASGDEWYIKGYTIWNDVTGQSDGESRSLAEAIYNAQTWNQLLQDVSLKDSGLQVPKSAH